MWPNSPAKPSQVRPMRPGQPSRLAQARPSGPGGRRGPYGEARGHKKWWGGFRVWNPNRLLHSRRRRLEKKNHRAAILSGSCATSEKLARRSATPLSMSGTGRARPRRSTRERPPGLGGSGAAAMAAQARGPFRGRGHAVPCAGNDPTAHGTDRCVWLGPDGARHGAPLHVCGPP